MKNVLVYVGPKQEFSDETKVLVKVQIDNSLDLGWRKEDIMLLTNFPYEYNGVKSIIVSDENYCPFRPLSTKTITVSNIELSDNLYWVHDFDAFQLSPLHVDISGYDMGCTDYGWSRKWCLGSFFCTEWASDILAKIRDTIYEIHNEDERALMHMTTNHDINKRIKRLNITYNLGMRHIDSNYKKADKPLQVAHFHPFRVLKSFVPLLDERILHLFHTYGIK